MNLTKCSNGHYYDGDQFAECPHCNGKKETITIAGEDPVPVSSVKIEPFTLSTPIGVGRVTEPPTGVRKQTVNQEKTVGYYFAETKSEPVVGWLVCLKGREFGKSFNLKSGRNFIGRNDTVNDIVIRGDKGISREKHAILIYDPKSRQFMVQPGISSELFYVNEEVVLQVMPIKDKDIIQLGSTKMMFVPCCGEDFTWDDFINSAE